MVPTALSQVVEAVARLAGGILLSLWMLAACRREYEALGTVFGRAAASSEQALSYARPYAAAAAVLGVALSTAAGTLFCLYANGCAETAER
jgi:stage V sporulation protein B